MSLYSQVLPVLICRSEAGLIAFVRRQWDRSRHRLAGREPVIASFLVDHEHCAIPTVVPRIPSVGPLALLRVGQKVTDLEPIRRAEALAAMAKHHLPIGANAAITVLFPTANWTGVPLAGLVPTFHVLESRGWTNWLSKGRVLWGHSDPFFFWPPGGVSRLWHNQASVTVARLVHEQAYIVWPNWLDSLR
jgi:hypothetical protein